MKTFLLTMILLFIIGLNLICAMAKAGERVKINPIKPGININTKSCKARYALKCRVV